METFDTAEELMRSRYAAFVRRDEEHLLRTWHEATRPPRVEFDPALTWTGLDVDRAEEDGGRAVVEFRAHFERDGQPGVLHEISRFIRTRDGWQYVRGRLVEP